ncbi:MAG TPA: XRE family transcriptional regulator [Kofleriaceae bacterium]|nr:XRE family transcriptional regulator [Kofleriaceae bacterium]
MIAALNRFAMARQGMPRPAGRTKSLRARAPKTSTNCAIFLGRSRVAPALAGPRNATVRGDTVTMKPVSLQARKLREVREASGLTRAQMADLLDEDEQAVGALEASDGAVDPQLLDRCARAFGLRVERLLSDDAAGAPGSLLFRSLNAEVIHELRARRAHFGLGDFLRTASDLAELAKLRTRKGAPASRPLADLGDSPQEVPDTDAELYRRAETLAYETRDRLGLGDTAVPSMIELLEERLQIPIVWSNPDEVDANIDGASTREPIPAVLVNLVGGRDCWWRTRMTLAHELCHLLFDALPDSGHRRMVMFSPHRDPSRDNRGRPRNAFQLPEVLERMERRANAFAVHFLAPGRAIRRLVARHDATSEGAVTLICQSFCVGRITAINQLCNVFILSKQERARMIARGGDESLPPDHPDAGPPSGRSPRCKTLRLWVDESLGRGWLSQVRARDYLGHGVTEPVAWNVLPGHGQAPILSEAAAVRLQVYAYLGRRDLTVSWRVDEPVADGERWRADVFDLAEGGERRARGVVVLSRSREVLPDETKLDSLAS